MKEKALRLLRLIDLTTDKECNKHKDCSICDLYDIKSKECSILALEDIITKEL